jgi:hypothetical protein
MAERDASAAEIGKRAADAAFGSAQDGTRRFGASLRDAMMALLAEQQQRLAHSAHGFAEALHRTADAQGEASPTVSRCADQAAMQLERLADTLRQRELGDLVDGAEGLARRQPALFIAGAVAAGFVATRLFAGPSPVARRPRGGSAGDGERSSHDGPHAAAAPQSGAAWGR